MSIDAAIAQFTRYGETQDYAHFEPALAAFDAALEQGPDAIDRAFLAGQHMIAGNRTRALELWSQWFAQHRLAERPSLIVPREQVRAIGHMTLLDAYVKMQLLGWRPPGRLRVIAPERKIANRHYLDYWRPWCDLVTNPDEIASIEAARAPSDHGIGACLVQGQPELLGLAVARAQATWEAQMRGPLLRLTDADQQRGMAMRRAFGMTGRDWYVCIHVREPGYHPGVAHEFRDASIEAMMPAIGKIIDAGGYVVRMGDPSMSLIMFPDGAPPRWAERVIDYAHSFYKSEWADVFLAADCRFFLGSASGLQMLPFTFGVPTVMVNAAAMGASRPVSGADLFIPKLARRHGELLSFAEASAEPIGHAQHDGFYRQRGVEFVENTGEEIAEVVGEMLGQNDSDIMSIGNNLTDLRARFHAATAAHSAWGSNARIGASFLKRHADLLTPPSDCG